MCNHSRSHGNCERRMLEKCIFEKNVRNPNNHYFSKSIAISLPPTRIIIKLCKISNLKKNGKCKCIKTIIVSDLNIATAYLKYSWNNLQWTAWILAERVHLQFLLQDASNLYCKTPPICIAVLSAPLSSKERAILSVLFRFVLQYASHLCRSNVSCLCRSTPPVCIAVLLGNIGGWGYRDNPQFRVSFRTKGQSACFS